VTAASTILTHAVKGSGPMQLAKACADVAKDELRLQSVAQKGPRKQRRFCFRL